MRRRAHQQATFSKSLLANLGWYRPKSQRGSCAEGSELPGVSFQSYHRPGERSPHRPCCPRHRPLPAPPWRLGGGRLSCCDRRSC
eukprot:scaffold95258_cov75-Phaeocystis_antarctica.AAC.3